MSMLLKPVFMAAACILMLIVLPAVAATKQKIVKVRDGVYAAFIDRETGLGANSGFVIGKDAVWVFDTQRVDVSTELLSEIRMLTAKPVKYVIHSHHHDERVDGNPVFTEATIVAHSAMSKHLIAKPRPGVRLPEITYDERLTFYDGDRELQLLHLGRAHTDGDSVLFLPGEKVLFIGEILPGKGSVGGHREAYFKEFVQTIDKLLALDFETIIPGRGDALATKDDLREFRNYLIEVLDKVQKFVDRGATLEETLAGVEVPDHITPENRKRRSFNMLWERMMNRAYAELK